MGKTANSSKSPTRQKSHAEAANTSWLAAPTGQ